MSEVSAGRPEGTSGKTGKRPLRVPEGPGYAHARALLGRAVRVRREKAQLTQAAAAELLGISERTLRDWEKGEGSLWTGGEGRTVDYAQMQTLKDVYLCAWADLVPRNQYPSAPLDPAARREFFIARNAMIQGNDPDEAVERILGAARSGAIEKGS